MNTVIEIIVSPKGETTLQTKGLAGTACREATRQIEQALGMRQTESLTSEFHARTQDRVDAFNQQLQDFQEELSEAVWRLSEHYAELQNSARDRLGSLYDPADYPESLDGMFRVDWEFVTVEPPDYLRQLNPEIYRQECQRVASRFDEAVSLAEAAFTEELHRLVAHLSERLTGQTDGKPKVFRDSAVESLGSFFNRFRQLNIHSNDQLDDLVDQCQQVVQGVTPQSLRDNQGLRQTVAEELGQVQSVLDGLLVDRPRRNILRRPR